MQSSVDFNSYRLYEQGAGQSRRIVEFVSRAKGERMVRSKTARAGLDWDGVTLCFERTDARTASAVPTFVPARALLSEPEVPSEPSNTAFSRPEVEAIAGTKFRYGKSRTIKMNEMQRANRKNQYGDYLPPEDLTERATNKLKAWEQLPALLDRIREVTV